MRGKSFNLFIIIIIILPDNPVDERVDLTLQEVCSASPTNATIKACLPSTQELQKQLDDKIIPMPATEMSKVVFNVAEAIFNTGTIPDNTTASAIVVLHKDGPTTAPDF